MGLDLIPEGAAKAGHEAEWRRMVERVFRGETISDADTELYQAISIPSYEQVGAPRVGYDKRADAWIIATRGAKTPAEVAQVLEQFHGHYALPLVKCDGLPEYTHANLYEGVDETSFRGKALELCPDVLTPERIQEAWTHKFPEDAMLYGRALLADADAAEASGPPPPNAPTPEPLKRGLFARLLGKKDKPEPDPVPFEEQLRIVRAAGRWFVFWAERGNAIRAWF
ncbi:MAG TPA: hypothetical protein VK533_03670 [Sphingomonas sp.]|uniref:hypothetical protein n=1 Tax=Sphingomonas sp. TaxID=28214 RepID=UPI002B5A80BB|nr:hypothetical protein [Sphingomonas sp.]HMI18621.1 hypothetical protein [Sphingomonas sp.]